MYGAISLVQCDTKINKKIVEELNDIHDGIEKALTKVLGKDTAAALSDTPSTPPITSETVTAPKDSAKPPGIEDTPV